MLKPGPQGTDHCASRREASLLDHVFLATRVVFVVREYQNYSIFAELLSLVHVLGYSAPACTTDTCFYSDIWQ